MDNKKIASVFEEMANILDIQGANIFRINAYKKGALTILNMPQDLRQIVENDPKSLPKIPGIGKGLAALIVELVETGKCKDHEIMKKSLPAGLLELLDIRGLGPKKIKLFYSNLAIKNINELKMAAEKHLIRDLEGMGEKSEKDIVKAIDEYSRFSTKRHLISEAMQEAKAVITYMKKCYDIKKIEYAGSLRRRKETIGDIDILVTVKDPVKSRKAVISHFTSYEEVLNVTAEGETKSSVILKSGIQVDLRVVNEESFGAAMHYFTGNKHHNIKIRDIAKRKGLKVNEYGVYRGKKLVTGKTEVEVFKAVGLPFIIPEIRRDEGEIEYAKKHKKFPRFVELGDIKGDVHSHSKYSDGKNTIAEMAEAFISQGYEYFAVTDHSGTMGITQGMKKADIKRQWKEIDKIQKKLGKKIKILKGVEVDILKDGQLDFEDEVLKELDIVVSSAHMFGRLPEKEQTKRILAAVENPFTKILGHPSGRLINRRAPMEFDMEKVIDACVDNKVALEINSSPMRLDLVDKYVKIAKDKGAKFVINTDSHDIHQPSYMEFGVGIARRGWLEKRDVLNALSWLKFDSYF